MSNITLLTRIISSKIIHTRQTKKGTFSKEKVIYPFRQLLHPIDTYNDLKFEKKASLRITFVLTLLFFFTQLLDGNAVAMLFRSSSKESGIFGVLASSLGLLVVWAACNWATCTISNGEGTFRDIWVMTTYSVVPYCAATLLSIGLSYVLSIDEAIFFTVLRTGGLFWTGILLFLGMMTAHQYTVLKTIISIILTLLMIVLCLFLLVMTYSILQQMWGFGFSIFKEVAVK